MRLTWKPLAAGAAAIVLLIGIIAAFATKSGAGTTATGASAAGGAASAKSVENPSAAEPPAAVDTWKQAGLTVSAFTPTDGKALGGDCQAGTVNGVDVELCTYPDEASAKKAEDAGFAAVGANTGVALAQGDTLLVATDHKKSDPSGRTLNQIAKLFRGGK